MRVTSHEAEKMSSTTKTNRSVQCFCQSNVAVLESFVCCEPAIMDEELSKIRFTGQLCDEFYNTGENFGKRREVGHGFSACK